MKVTLTAVNRKDRVSTKTGKPFVSVGIKTNEHGEKWLSGFGNAGNASWKVGDVVDIDIEQKGEYLNFNTPKTATGMSQDDKDMLQKIYREVYATRQAVVLLKQVLEGKDTPTYPEYAGEPNFEPDEVINPADVPW